MAQAASRGIWNTFAMILAFLAIGGFLFWLSAVSEPTEVVVAEEETVAQAVSLALFARSPGMYEGELVQVDGVVVQSTLGTQGFLVALPDGTAYPVRIDPSAIAQVPAPGSQGSITGEVHALTDSVIDAWAAESLFADEAEREAVSAATTFLFASDVEVQATDTAADTTAGDGA